MLFVVSGSILAWPLGDLYFGPTLASVAARSSTAPDVETDGERRAAKALGEGGTTLRVAAFDGAGRAYEAAAARSGRPVVYVTLREATSAHDLLCVSGVCGRAPRRRGILTRFCLVASIYSSERLGVAGTVAQSMGIWWIVLSRRRVFCARKRTIPAAAGSTSSSATIRRTRGPSTSRSSASTCAGASRARRSGRW